MSNKNELKRGSHFITLTLAVEMVMVKQTMVQYRLHVEGVLDANEPAQIYVCQG